MSITDISTAIAIFPGTLLTIVLLFCGHERVKKLVLSHRTLIILAALCTAQIILHIINSPYIYRVIVFLVGSSMIVVDFLISSGLLYVVFRLLKI
jgi:hypothetical protein